MAKTLVELTAEIIQSQCSTTSMSNEEITVALQTTFKALQNLQVEEAKAVLTDAPPADQAAAPVQMVPERSIQKNKIVCLECGQEFKMLSPKHLKSHGLTGREYRVKYGFSLRKPLCAKALSERRKKAGKERGLPENLKKAIDKRKRATKRVVRKK